MKRVNLILTNGLNVPNKERRLQVLWTGGERECKGSFTVLPTNMVCVVRGVGIKMTLFERQEKDCWGSNFCSLMVVCCVVSV